MIASDSGSAGASASSSAARPVKRKLRSAASAGAPAADPDEDSKQQQQEVQLVPAVADSTAVLEAAHILRGCSRVLVLVGAGISVSAGVPDFRSKDGLYDLIRRAKLGVTSPQTLFDIDHFLTDPAPFYAVAHMICGVTPKPTISHAFLKQLQDHGKLLRVYTQNVDGLEQEAGLTDVVQVHGTLGTATCLRCQHQVKFAEIRDTVLSRQVPTCQQPWSNAQIPEAEGSRRSKRIKAGQEAAAAANDGKCGGVLKPDITFFGEDICRTISRQLHADAAAADALIIIGTSLQVAPMSNLPNIVRKQMPIIWINRIPRLKLPTVHRLKRSFTVELIGDADAVVSQLTSTLEWS